MIEPRNVTQIDEREVTIGELLLGNYKLMKFYETGRLVLFDLDQDLSEQNDLSQQMPQRVKELDGLLVKYLKDVDAQMPVSNPQYDPSREPGVQKDRGGREKGRMKPKPIRGLMVASKRTYRAGDENWLAGMHCGLPPTPVTDRL